LQLEAVENRIRNHLQQKRERLAMEIATNPEKGEEEKVEDPLEQGKVEDQKRKFIVKYRPHEKIWNFVEDDPNNRLPHLLRANADPTKAYIDTRVSDLLRLIEGMAQHLLMHNQESWNHINSKTIEIFMSYEKDMKRRMEDYNKMLEEAAQK